LWEGAKAKQKRVQRNTNLSPPSVEWIAKPQYEEKSHAFLNDLMVSLVAFKKGDIEVPPLSPKPAAANIAPTPRPPKNDLLGTHRSRFNTGN